MNRFRRDEKREGIVKTYRARRDADEAALPPPDEGDDVGPDQGSPPEGAAPSDSGPRAAGEDPELELMVYGERYKITRSKLVDTYNLEGLPNHVIVSVAQKQMAADQRLARVKEREAEPTARFRAGRQRGASAGSIARADRPIGKGERAGRRRICD